MTKHSKPETFKLIIMIPLSVGLQIGIIKCLDFVSNWSMTYNLLLTVVLTTICTVLLSSILSVFFIYYSEKYYRILIYTFTPILVVCLYYVIFIYGFDWFSALLIFYPFMYLGGIKHYLINDLGYQMYLGLKEDSKRKKEFVEDLMKKKSEKNIG
jgi:hypothetical protein